MSFLKKEVTDGRLLSQLEEVTEACNASFLGEDEQGHDNALRTSIKSIERRSEDGRPPFPAENEQAQISSEGP